MNRGQLKTRALRVVGDSNLTTQAEEWLDNILYELDGLGYWRFLEDTESLATVAGTSSYTLSSTAAVAKGLTVYSNEPRLLDLVPIQALLDMQRDSATGFPRFAAIFGNKIYLYPTPTGPSSAPVLTFYYYKNITVPTEDNTDLETAVGIKKRYHKFLLDGMIAQGLKHIDDERQDAATQKWEQDILIMMADHDEFRSKREQEVSRPAEQLHPREK